MKVTDYIPRAAFLDFFLDGHDLVGLEIGVDVGAHAHALLKYSDIRKLYLVDVWENPEMLGYCKGRLSEYHHKTKFIQCSSLEALDKVPDVDFIYFDQLHDYESVKQDLAKWTPKAKIIGHRNYHVPEIKQAINEWIGTRKHEISDYHGEIVVWI